jgi:transposase
MGLELSKAPEPVRTTRNGRRYFSKEHKRAIVERCLAPGASVAAIALECGFNANLVRKWIRTHQARQAAVPSGTLIPVSVQEEAVAVASEEPRAPRATRRAVERSSSSIEIELGAAKLILHGTVDATQLRLVLEAVARYR